MKSCKILRYGAVCGLAALAAVGCSVDDAETIRVRELTAAEHELFVPASGGTAQIQLYSNGRVRVEALSDIGGWASVDRSEFDGDRMVSVTFTENDSFRRMAKLRFVLDGGTRADTVCIKQYGVVPSLECPAPYKAIRGSVETFTQFEIDTNIPLGDFAVATAYVGPTRDWIRSVQPEQGMLVVDTKPNPGEDVCKAVVNLSYVDGWEETFSANLYITQADKDDEFGREVSFADVRALATAEGTAVDEDILIEGIVVSDFHSKNMEANPSVSYDKVDVTVNRAWTAATASACASTRRRTTCWRAARASRSRSAARSSRARRIPSATRSAAWSAKTWSKALPERRFPSSSVGFRN